MQFNISPLIASFERTFPGFATVQAFQNANIILKKYSLFKKWLRNWKKVFHKFVELVETNKLMYNIKDLG